jgi:hypothetical protein
MQSRKKGAGKTGVTSTIGAPSDGARGPTPARTTGTGGPRSSMGRGLRGGPGLSRGPRAYEARAGGASRAREAVRRRRSGEERRWLEVLTEAGAERAKFQHAYAEGEMTLEDLKTRTAELGACHLARTEFADAKASSERLRALETDAETVVALYSKMVPESLDTITPEEPNRLYRTLRLGVGVHPDGRLEVGGGIRVCTEGVMP